MHNEDVDLYSVNYVHFGDPKTWISIPPSYGRKLEKACAEAFPKVVANCASFLRHKTTLLSPQWLKDHNIPFDTVIQGAGQFVVNNGLNCAEAVNFATERWIDYGKAASECSCSPDFFQFSMEVFVKKYQSDEQYQQRLENNHLTANPEHDDKISRVEKTLKQQQPELYLVEFFEDPHIDRGAHRFFLARRQRQAPTVFFWRSISAWR